MQKTLSIVMGIIISIFMFSSCDKKNPTAGKKLVTVAYIKITPAIFSLKNSEAQQLICIATYTDSSTLDVGSWAIWSTSSGSAGSISSDGLFTASGNSSGTEIVTAKYDGQEKTAKVVVLEMGTVTDIDGNVYETVKIGNQWWMAENLKVTHYRNGDEIVAETNDADWARLTVGAYCYNDNDPINATIYGCLYNWIAVNDSSIIAPEGWHVSTDAEWKELEMFLGLDKYEVNDIYGRGTNEGGKLKATGLEYWVIPNAGATNETGFSALPGGSRDHDGSFGMLGMVAYFWTTTSRNNDDNAAWIHYVHWSGSTVGREPSGKVKGHSVRCVRD